MAQNLTNLLYFKIVMISYKIINYYICRIDLMELAEKLFFEIMKFEKISETILKLKKIDLKLLFINIKYENINLGMWKNKNWN